MCAQVRYHDYLSEVKSKKAMDPIGLSVGIGPCFGFNVISYDGAALYIGADPEKNYRYNLTNERLVLTNTRSGCITPDGIMAVETGNIVLPLILGEFSGYKEVLLIATHIYDKTEGGSSTTYRAVLNPNTTGDWNARLSKDDATMETWLDIAKGIIRRNQEVILGCFRIERVGKDHRISNIKNPYHYVWGISNYVTLDRHITDINNLKSLIPIFESNKLTINNKGVHVSIRSFINDPDVKEDAQAALTLLEPDIILNKLGDALDLFFGGTLDFSRGGIDVSKQIVIDISGEVDYVTPVAIEARWQAPIDFDWLTAASENPTTGKRNCQNTHAVEGILSLDKNKVHILMSLFPIKGNQGAIAANLLPKMSFTQRLSFMAQLSEMFDVILDVQSQEGTTGTGEVSGSGKYRRGTMVVLNASPAIGSGFVGWYEGNTLVSAEASYQVELVRSINYIAMFNGSSTKVEIKVKITPEGKATVTGTGMYAINTQATLKATPLVGYGFKEWVMNGQKYTLNPLTFGVTKGTTVDCILTAPKREVRVFSNPSGIFSVVGAGNFEVGKNVTVGATLINNTYIFKGWYFDSVSSANLASTNPNYSFAMPDKNLNLMAYGELKPTQRYQVSVSASGNGYATGSGWYDEGTTATLHAYGTDGGTFSNWSGDATGSSNPVTVTVNSNLYITANFTGGGTVTPPDPGVTRYNLYTTATGNGTISGGGTYDEGTTVTITANPGSGATFTGWGGAATGTTNPTTVYMNADKTVTANFTGGTVPPPEQFTLTITASGPGTVNSPGTGSFKYNSGTNVNISVTPNQGYRATYGGIDSGHQTNNAFVLMDRNRAVEITFVTADIGPGGVVVQFIGSSGTIGKAGGIYHVGMGYSGGGGGASYTGGVVTTDIGSVTSSNSNGADISIPANPGSRSRDITLTLSSNNPNTTVGSPKVHTVTQAGGDTTSIYHFYLNKPRTGVQLALDNNGGGGTLSNTTPLELTLVAGQRYAMSVHGASVTGYNITGGTLASGNVLVTDSLGDGGSVSIMITD